MKASVVGLTALALLLAGVAFAEETSEEASSRAWGKELFSVHCAPCHGKDAKGRGPVAAALKKPPKDLTKIAERNGGTFPDDAIEEALPQPVTRAAPHLPDPRLSRMNIERVATYNMLVFTFP